MDEDLIFFWGKLTIKWSMCCQLKEYLKLVTIQDLQLIYEQFRGFPKFDNNPEN